MAPESHSRSYFGRFCDAYDTVEGPSCPLNTDAPPVHFPSAPERSPAQSAGFESWDAHFPIAEALQLLCSAVPAALVDFDAFFFLTDALTVGGPLTVPAGLPDNIARPAASLRRLSLHDHDLLYVEGAACLAIPDGPVMLAKTELLHVCAVKAIAFQVLKSNDFRSSGDDSYHRTLRAIHRAVREHGSGLEAASDQQSRGCPSILAQLAAWNPSRLVTLAVGPLVLQQVSVLGAVGSVLLLSSQELERFYLIHANNIQLLG